MKVQGSSKEDRKAQEKTFGQRGDGGVCTSTPHESGNKVKRIKKVKQIYSTNVLLYLIIISLFFSY